MDRTLQALKRCLENAELIHLRQHAADLAERLEMMEERAMHAENQADWYYQQHTNLVQSLMEQDDLDIGLAPDGTVGIICGAKAC